MPYWYHVRFLWVPVNRAVQLRSWTARPKDSWDAIIARSRRPAKSPKCHKNTIKTPISQNKMKHLKPWKITPKTAQSPGFCLANRFAKLRHANMGPTVWLLEGPMPIFRSSKTEVSWEVLAKIIRNNPFLVCLLYYKVPIFDPKITRRATITPKKIVKTTSKSSEPWKNL